MLPDLAQGQQPGVEDTQLLVPQRSSNASAGSMTAEDYVIDSQVTDGVLDDGRRAKIARVKDIGNVSVHEDITGFHVENGGFRAPRVGAADPEDLGLLAPGKGREEIRVFPGGSSGPFFVLGQSGGILIYRRGIRGWI